MKKQTRKYIFVALAILSLLFLTSCSGATTRTYEPITGVHGFLDVLVWPMSYLMFILGKFVFFNNYGLAIIVTTIIVRTLAWPIYAKTNDMTLKMQMMGPDQQRIEQKYQGRTDPESNQRKQMEMMQLYKKYGIGIGGCLLPIVQFPIFIAFYETLQRIPVTRGDQFKLNFSFLDGNFFGINLFETKDFSKFQLIGIIVLAALVGATQIISQIMASKRQKKAKENSQSNIPEYRKVGQTDVQKQTETTMKFMMYGMTAMMVLFVYNSTAALGLYWLVGNLYSTLQGHVGYKQSQKRMDKLKAKM